MARAQGAQANAKEDTVFLALAGAPTVDLSQQLTNITASGAGAFEAPSARSVLVSERTVSVRWTATAAEVGKVLIICGNQALTDIVWAIATDGTGSICGYQGASVGIIQASAPTLAKDYIVSLSMRANPDTTGAADAVISELAIYNITDATFDDVVQSIHAAPAAATGPYDLAVGGWWNGLALISPPTNPVTQARVSVTHHPAAEVFEDWAGARVAYAGTADDGPSEPLGPIPSSSTMGDESEIAGRHPWGYSAAHALGTRRRAWSSQLAEVDVEAATMPTDQDTVWAAPAPGDPAYTIDLSRGHWLQVPIGTTHVRARVQVRSWVTAGAAVPIHFRAYAWNRPPTLGQIGAGNAPSLRTYSGESSLTLDDEFGVGVWLDLGLIATPVFADVVTGWARSVGLALAYAVDPGGLSGNDAAARFAVDGFEAVPVEVAVPWLIIEL